MGRSGKRGAGDEPAQFFCFWSSEYGCLAAARNIGQSGYRCSCACWLGRRVPPAVFVEKVVVRGTKKDDLDSYLGDIERLLYFDYYFYILLFYS